MCLGGVIRVATRRAGKHHIYASQFTSYVLKQDTAP